MASNDDHKQAMQEAQTKHREKMATKTRAERGLVLIHTGKGKGKSSSAFGVVARALGWGHKVGIVQFIKGKWKTGEREFFQKIPQIDWHTMGDGFTWDTQDKEQDTQAAVAAFAQAAAMMNSGDYDLIVLDEINIALRYDYLDAQAVKEALEARAEKTSVILTGRDAKPLLMEYADLVTEMTEVKHPFQAGIKAQRGVDY
ncbi:cob(I)yrinic acid a,c-diamide adenosyltransferase [Pontivivens insulae]|uniref:Corrinoid adenosyltransferase n=1 Tax=Pontivivens insulae TaxID=1639689 RepID=A0A2R8AG95_9RHOB|nr:cob(I)yrinic acid a,c-diamide adenosyltransferase [Pontivivens insulae]RED12308.1 cob(I)yrinic acid a,c-diamide adenosyltransferase [Pontivivens insulae]SPF31065.1 Cob(I)yrinic acid a,c-diamide adenosyltransferase [Pontivivens insulae]